MDHTDENNHITPFHDKGELNSEWCLWWRFQMGKTRGYDASQLQEVYTFKNMNTFSQIYNASVLGKISSFMSSEKKMVRGNSEKDIEFQNLPVDCLMLFRGSVRPEWEDPKNAKGGHFMIELINPDSDCSDDLWKELSMCLVGEIWEHSQYVNIFISRKKCRHSNFESIKIFNFIGFKGNPKYFYANFLTWKCVNGKIRSMG